LTFDRLVPSPILFFGAACLVRWSEGPPPEAPFTVLTLIVMIVPISDVAILSRDALNAA